MSQIILEEERIQESALRPFRKRAAIAYDRSVTQSVRQFTLRVSMCEDARWPWSRKAWGGRTKTSRNRSLLPASYSHTDRRTQPPPLPWLRRLPAPTSALRPSLSDRPAGRATPEVVPPSSWPKKQISSKCPIPIMYLL